MFAIMVEDDDGEYVEYTDSNEWPTGMVFNEENSGCVDASGNTVNATLSYSDGYVSVSTNDTVYCYLYFDMPLDCIKEGITSLSECILRSENNFDSEEEAIEYIKNEKGTPDFSVTATDDEGLYYAEDDYGDSYYFRGSVTDNYVYFAGYYWRIIRINGDGSIRMIYDGTYGHDNGTTEDYSDRSIGISAFNSTYSHNRFVGYMYGSLYHQKGGTTLGDKTLQSHYYYYAEDYTFNTETGYYTLGDDASQQIWNDGLEGYYTCRSTSTTCTTLYYISAYKNMYQGAYYMYTSTSETDENDVTTYTESHGTSVTTGTFATRYYYGTGYTFNSETGYYYLTDYAYGVWDGTEDLVHYYTCASSKTYCTSLYYIDNANSEMMAEVYTYTRTSSSTYSDYHANENDSTIKQAVDDWYYTYIYNAKDGDIWYDDYISDTLFCNDRSLYSGTGIGTAATEYGASGRLVTNKSPILTCPQQNDAFTLDDEVNGNGALTYKVGLITADEVAMAGSVFQTINTDFYLYGDEFYTMSPGVFRSTTSYAHVFSLGTTSSKSYVLNYYHNSSASYSVRPVINLSSSVILTSGDGTKDSPYEVTLSS